MLFFLALFYGIDLDNLTLINNFSFTWAGISGFLLHLVGESLNWLAHLLHQISIWLWDKSFDFPRLNKDLKTLEQAKTLEQPKSSDFNLTSEYNDSPVRFDSELVADTEQYEQLLSKKDSKMRTLKDSLFQTETEDNSWFSKRNIVIGCCILAVCGVGILTYNYFFSGNTPPSNTENRPSWWEGRSSYWGAFTKSEVENTPSAQELKDLANQAPTVDSQLPEPSTSESSSIDRSSELDTRVFSDTGETWREARDRYFPEVENPFAGETTSSMQEQSLSRPTSPANSVASTSSVDSTKTVTQASINNGTGSN